MDTTKHDEQIWDIVLDWLKTSDNEDTRVFRYHVLQKIKGLEVEVDEYRNWIAGRSCQNLRRVPTPLDDKNFEPCGECLPCKAKADLEKRVEE